MCGRSVVDISGIIPGGGTSATWTQASLSLASGYTFSDIIEFNGVLFASIYLTSNGTPVSYYYSTNGGVSWTQSTLANSAVLYFAIRGETSGSPILWTVRQEF